MTDEKLTGRFKLIRHGEKKTNFKRKKDSWNHERMGTPRVTCEGLSKCPSIIFSSINMFAVLDIDECGASSPVCDINANCSNTRGSYICTCRTGYTGDGKTCQGRINVDLL